LVDFKLLSEIHNLAAAKKKTNFDLCLLDGFRERGQQERWLRGDAQREEEDAG
jgi:hypothetical protein